MKKEILVELVNDGLSTYKISDKLNKSQTSVRYWLKKYNLSTIIKPSKNSDEQKFCSRCGEIKNRDEFYKRRGKEGDSVYCKSCTTEQTLERIRLFKQKCVEYKGGKCERCGYDKYNGALDFHHIEPDKKDFTIANIRSYSFDDKVKKELDKCILICANCHREIHNEEYKNIGG
jgi:predicted HNH restriction endonuclease